VTKSKAGQLLEKAENLRRMQVSALSLSKMAALYLFCSTMRYAD